MKKVISVWIFMMLLLVMSMPCQAQWAVRIRGIGSGPDTEDVANSVKQTSDGGYIVAGGMGGDFWVIRLDAHGAVIWQKAYATMDQYGRELEDVAYSIQQTVDGGFIVAGKSDWLRFWVLKLDANGGIVWQNFYNNQVSGGAKSIQQTMDGGYIVAGQGLGEHGDIGLIKLDGDGNVEWEKTYGGTDQPHNVRQTADGGYIVAGDGYRGGDYFVMKLSPAGAVVWQKNYGGLGDESEAVITQTTDGGYILAGITYGSDVWGTDILVLKLDSSGEITWQLRYAGKQYEYVYSIQQTRDGGYVLAGSTDGSPAGGGGSRVWVLKLNQDGTHAWDKTFGGMASGANSIEQTADNGFIVAGWMKDWIFAYRDILVLKLDANGDIPGCSVAGEKNIAGSYPVSTVALNTNVAVYSKVSNVINSNAVVRTPTYQHFYLCMVANHPPVLNPIGSKTVSEGQLLEFGITATDSDGDTLAYCASNLPNGATFDPVARTFSWTPTFDQAGNYPQVRFTVTDNGQPPASASQTITITVGNVNRPPFLNPIGSKTVNEGELLEFTITATDPDGDALTYAANNLPPGATFDPATQTFRWTPTYDQAGTYSNIEFDVMDSGSPAEVDVELIAITVGNVNRAPVFTPVGTQEILENQDLRFFVTATDYEGDAITYTTGPIPGGASFNPITGLFSWRPDYSQSGTCTVVFFATDSGTPSMTSQMETAIIVGDVPTPCESAGRIIQTVVGLTLPKAVENSYMANLKKVCGFVEEGKITPAINQMNAFINKVNADMQKGIVGSENGNKLITMAIGLINTLGN